MTIGITNRAKIRRNNLFLRGDPAPNGFSIVLVTGSVEPGPDTKILGELDEIPAGNGYASGGEPINRDNIDFPISDENDDTDSGNVTMRDVTFNAVDGPIPSSGPGIKFFVLTDNNGTLSEREIFAYGEFEGAAKIIEETGILSIIGFKQSLIEPT